MKSRLKTSNTDDHPSKARVKLLFCAIIVFFVALWFSWTEIDYALWSTTTTGEITRVEDRTKTGRLGIEKTTRYALYTFADATNRRCTDSCRVADDWLPPDDKKVAIDYIGNHESFVSRISGPVRAAPFIMLIGSLGLVLILSLLWYREFRQHEARKAASASR